MSERGRTLAFLALAVAVGALGLALAHARPGSPSISEPHGRASASTRPVVVAQGEHRTPERDRRRVPATSSAAAEDLPPDRRPSATSLAALAEARRAAAGFVRALLRHEAGEDSTPVRRALGRTAGAGLARRVLSRRPRSPLGAPRAPRGRLASLSLLSTAADSAELAATVRRGDRRSGLLLALRAERDGWKVAALR